MSVANLMDRPKGHQVLATEYTLNESRLGALASFGILDTLPEAGFDSIVELATHLCACPVALVSLVDSDRQWFKARVGFPLCQTDLNSSVCAHALSEPDITVISDLMLDPRTASNPLVVGDPHIRFYAGAPLRTADGHGLGSLCVIDHKPRPEGLTPVQAGCLKALAGQVMTQLELRRLVTEQRQEIERGDTLIRTQAAISAARGDIDLILQALAAGAMEVLPHAEGSAIEIRDGDDLVYRAAAGVIAHEIGLRVPLRDSFAGSCLLAGTPMLCGDVLRDGKIKPAMVERLKIRSCVVVPISLGGEAVGVLKLQASVPDAFTRNDLRLARVFSGSVTAGLADAAFLRQAKELRGIVELGDRLRDATTAGEAMLIGGEMAGRSLSGLRAGYCAVDADTDMLTIPAHWGESSIAGMWSLRDFGSFIDELKQGRPVVINDPATDPRTADHAAAFHALGVHSVINLPVIERGRMVSVFFVHRADRHHWTEEEIALCGNIADRTRAAVARLQAEAQQGVLNEELSHRMKNTMAMVQAIAVQTLKDVRDKEAVAAFTDRVHALASAHNVLLQASWVSALILPVVTAALSGFRQMDRFEIEGPQIRLGPRAVLALTMLLHELATNAIKYGALSAGSGVVHLEWRLEEDSAGDELVLDWVERGGPPVVEPTRKGFGSRLIRLGLVGTGGVTLDYQRSGLKAELRALLAHVQQF